MFGHFHEHRHGGLGRGKGRGRGRRCGFGPGAPRQRGAGRHFADPTRQARGPVGEEAPRAEADVCPLCDNHCPLSDPGCKQGRAFRDSLAGRDGQ